MSERSYDLNLEMINILSREFDVQAPTDKYADGLAAGKDAGELAKDVFGSYGVAWAKRTLELGEKYTDQTYENLKIVSQRVKRVIFPHIPQRFVEIGYLATQPFETLAVEQNNHSALIFRVPGCATYAALKEKCGEKVAGALPCKEACMAFNDTIYKDLQIPASLEMEAGISENGCRFVAKNLNIIE
ncbi:MAG: hypothetical protein ACYCX4_16875 [Bacillota bacterium]